MNRKVLPHYFKSNEHGTLVSVDDVAAAIQALAEKDEAELFDLASSGGLDDVFPFDVVSTDEGEPFLGHWSDLINDENLEDLGQTSAEEDNLKDWGQALAEHAMELKEKLSNEEFAHIKDCLQEINVEMESASPWFKQLLIESTSRDPSEALHDVRLLERFLELQNELPLDLKELLK